MFSSNKPQAIIYLRRGIVELVTKDGLASLELGPEIMQNLEPSDKTRFLEQVTKFLNANRIIKKKVMIVLDDSVVFEKVVPLTKQTDLQRESKDYESKIPFTPQDRQLLTVSQSNQLVMFGVNKSIYQLIAGSASYLGNHVIGVVPSVVYGLTDGRKLDKTTFNLFLEKRGAEKIANFLALA